MDPFLILKTTTTRDYELLDSGDGEKLERYGSILLSRPDPQALWPKQLAPTVWSQAKARFTRNEKAGWKLDKDLPKEWLVGFGNLNFWVKPTAFKHVGVFPEQLANWEWSMDLIQRAKQKNRDREISVLNLFGYTGGATVAALTAGASVTHVDASTVAINWAKRNAEASGVIDKPVRWMLDDAHAFIKREIKRGKKYDAIIMDPPAFGHGPKGELWKIEQNLPSLFELCKLVLSDNPLFVIVNGYASGYSAIAYHNNLEVIMRAYSGTHEIGELTIEESRSKRLLPAGIVARWKANNI